MISQRPLFSWIFERHRGLQLLLFVMIVATIFFRVFPLEIQKRIINTAIHLRRVEALLLYCGLYLGAVALAGILKYLINVLQGYIGQRILYDMRTQLYNHILTLPISFFRRTPPGMVIASLTSELSVIGEFIGGSLAVPIINILTLVCLAGYLAYLNPLLALLSFSIYPVEIIIIPFLQSRFNRMNQKRIDLTRSMSNVIGEAISGVHEIHGSSSYQVEGRKLDLYAGKLFTLRHRMNIVKFLIKFLNNFFQSLGPFILFLLGGYLTIEGQMDLGALVAFLSAHEKLYDPWKELMDYYQDLQDCRVRYRQVMDYFDVEPEFVLKPEENREPCRLTGEMSLSEVSFLVDGKIRILDQVSLDLNRGDQLALVGLSGSGKSTLAMIMGQLYSYSSGHVRVDGLELKDLTKYDISHNIGYVAQYPFIFDGTILENVLYACSSLHEGDRSGRQDLPEMDDVLEVIHAVGLAEDILTLGLGTMLVPDRHATLAGRLILARAAFHRRWGSELAEGIEFFEENCYQHYMSLAANVVFGYPNRVGFEPDLLVRSPVFRSVLEERELIEPLVSLGFELAQQTVSLLGGLQEEAFFFEMSPIAPEEIQGFSDLLERAPKTGLTELRERDRNELLKLALRFTPAHHKMAALSPLLEARVLGARHRFMERIVVEDPGAFTFYRRTEYLFSQTILENMLFGHPKTDHPLASEGVRRRVVELLEEENLLDEVMQTGLDFQVGSKGDRLSGGQKQKVAIARVLLKNPPIIILDEATASLDNTSQAQIQHLFNTHLKGRITLITVAHRLEMVRDYDVIAVMKGGKIVEIGHYEELMTRKGLFYELAHGPS